MSRFSESRWSDYYAATLARPLHPHYQNLEPHLPVGGKALELGCGVGHGALHLAAKGFRVTAVDAESEAIELLQGKLAPNSGVEAVQSRFQDFALGHYDLVVAQFCLFFLQPREFEEFWPRLVGSLNPGGVLSCQLLGVNDEWNDGTMAVHTQEEIDILLRPFDVLYFEEAERDGETAVGNPKHWHVFHVVARKRHP